MPPIQKKLADLPWNNTCREMHNSAKLRGQLYLLLKLVHISPSSHYVILKHHFASVSGTKCDVKQPTLTLMPPAKKNKFCVITSLELYSSLTTWHPAMDTKLRSVPREDPCKPFTPAYLDIACTTVNLKQNCEVRAGSPWRSSLHAGPVLPPAAWKSEHWPWVDLSFPSPRDEASHRRG